MSFENGRKCRFLFILFHSNESNWMIFAHSIEASSFRHISFYYSVYCAQNSIHIARNSSLLRLITQSTHIQRKQSNGNKIVIISNRRNSRKDRKRKKCRQRNWGTQPTNNSSIWDCPFDVFWLSLFKFVVLWLNLYVCYVIVWHLIRAKIARGMLQWLRILLCFILG